MPDRFSIQPPDQRAIAPLAPLAPPTHALATPAPYEELDEGPDWRRAFAAIRRHATLVLVTVAVGALATVLVARRTLPTYKATATIWIASQNEVLGRGGQLGPIRQDQMLQWESWVDLLHSFAILDPVVRDLRLNIHPDSPSDSALFRGFRSAPDVQGGDYTLAIAPDGGYRLSERRQPSIERGVLGDSIGRRLGFLWAPARDSTHFGRDVKFTVLTLRASSEQLSEALQGRVDRNGAFLRVELPGQSPTTTAAIVNAIASRYVAVASDLKRKRLAEFADNLEDQRSEAFASLEKAEKELEQFRIRNVGLPRGDELGIGAGPGGRTAAEAPASAGAAPVAPDGLELDRVRRDRRAIAHWLGQPVAARSPSGPLITAAGASAADLTAAVAELARKRADLRTLKYRYEDGYPAVSLLTEDIATLSEQTLPAIVRQLDADLAVRERELGSRVAARNDTLRSIPARMLEEARLVRASALAADLHASVQQRLQEARLAQSSSPEDVWVLDAASPAQLPSSDHRARVLALGFIASIGFALALAVFLDRMDPRVRYPAEVSRRMGLQILGAVPYLRARNGNGAITPTAAEEVTEALRAVRVALTHSGSVTRPLQFTISSSGPGDGKSFLSSNLGLSFALAGYRTLVIDGDVRRGTLHRAFGTQRRPGLTDCLRGEVTASEIIQRTPFEKLTLIGSGTRTRVAPELLGGPAMQSLLDGLKADYDVIICDSPPLSAGIDPYVLGTVTGQLLLVLRTGVSVRSVLEAKLAVLSQLPVRILGAVLNAVPAGELYRPYSYYVEGYQAADEVDARPPLPAL